MGFWWAVDGCRKWGVELSWSGFSGLRNATYRKFESAFYLDGIRERGGPIHHKVEGRHEDKL